jgi:hypothetical protein
MKKEDKELRKFKDRLYKKLLTEFRKRFKKEGMCMDDANKVLNSEQFKNALRNEIKYVVKNCTACKKDEQLDAYVKSVSEIFMSFLKKQFNRGVER